LHYICESLSWYFNENINILYLSFQNMQEKLQVWHFKRECVMCFHPNGKEGAHGLEGYGMATCKQTNQINNQPSMYKYASRNQ
jgi:hypothetical protein